MGICMARCSGVRYQELEPGPLPHYSTLSLEQQQHCAVCYEPDAKFPLGPPTNECAHPADVCASCLETYVCTNIKGGILGMKCVSMLCREQMDIDEVLQTRIAEKHKETFEKFCELKLRRKLDTEPDVVWCKAPGCGSAQIHIGGAEYPMVVCHECSARACFTHDTPWHEGKSCAEFTEELKRSPKWRREIKKNEKWLKRNTKACPGEGCGRPVQKYKGCDHMACRQPAGCGHEFCWQCLAPYRPIRLQGNGFHKPTCKHYR